MKTKQLSMKIYSLVIAIILSTPSYITFFRVKYNIGLQNTLSIIAAVIILGLIFSMLLAKEVFYKKSLFIFELIVIALFFFIPHTHNISNYSFIQFGFYFIVPLLIVQQSYNFEKVLEYIIYLSLPLILGINLIISITNYGLFQADMYNTYSFVPTIVAAIHHFLFYRKNSNIIIKIGYIINAYYLYTVSITAVRGFWLTILCYIACILLLYFQKKNSKSNYTILIVFVTLTIGISLIFSNEVINFLILLMKKVFSVNVGILVKTQELLSRGDLFNGRLEIWQECCNYIFRNGILGNGIDSVVLLTGGTIKYPHNVFIQLMVDCGILVAIYPVTLIVYATYIIFKREKNSYDIKENLIYFYSISIPCAMLTGNIWKSAALWILISFCSKVFFNRRKINNEKC